MLVVANNIFDLAISCFFMPFFFVLFFKLKSLLFSAKKKQGHKERERVGGRMGEMK